MLVDTSVWIDFFNGHESKQVEHLACAIAESEPIVVPGVVLTEILLGLKNDAEAERISSLLNAFDAVAEPTREDYIEAARIYRLCRATGFRILKRLQPYSSHSIGSAGTPTYRYSTMS